MPALNAFTHRPRPQKHFFPLLRVNVKFLSLAGKALYNMASAYLRNFISTSCSCDCLALAILVTSLTQNCLLCPFLHLPEMFTIARPHRLTFPSLRLFLSTAVSLSVCLSVPLFSHLFCEMILIILTTQVLDFGRHVSWWCFFTCAPVWSQLH